MKNDDFHPGAVRLLSNHVSSPTMRPATRVIPSRFNATARRASPFEVSEGSPNPFR